MATRTWSISYDSTTRGTDVDYGNTADAHHPIGRHQSVSTVYRMFAKFNVDTSGMASISSAILHLRSTGQTHIAFGSSPTLRVTRLTSSLANTSGGSSEGTWSSSARPTRSTEPSVTTSGQSAATNISRSENTWATIDITGIAQAWLAGSANYGIRVKAEDESSNADAWECSSADTSYKPYITVTYTETVSNTAPTATLTGPANGTVATMSYPAGSGWASPRVPVTWTYSDPEGDAQSAYQVIVYNDSTGSPGTTLVDTGKVAGADLTVTPVATYTEGNYYHVKVMVWDSHDLASSWTSTARFRTRWGAAEYVYDTGGTPTAWGSPVTDGDGSVIVEYNSSTATGDPGAGLGTWSSTFTPVPLQRYVRYRVWLLPGTIAPLLRSITIPYTSAALPTADNWVLGSQAFIEQSTYVFGTRSCKVVSNATWQYARSDLFTLRPNTRYMLSAFILDPSDKAVLGVATTGFSSWIAHTDAPYTESIDAGNGWKRVWVSFDSGSLTEAMVILGANGTSATVYFDAVKVEATTALMPWRPSSVSAAVTLDAAGIRVDGSEGGTMRLRGSTGGSRDTVELGTNGLVLGGDVALYSGDAQTLNLGDSGIVAGGTAFPSTPTTYLRYFRTDLGMEFFYDGTRWVTTSLHNLQVSAPRMVLPLTATSYIEATPPHATLDYYVYDLIFWSSVLTTNDGTRYWTCALFGSTASTINNTAGTWTKEVATVNALQDADANIEATVTRVGSTPGNAYVALSFTYRLVAT